MSNEVNFFKPKVILLLFLLVNCFDADNVNNDNLNSLVQVNDDFEMDFVLAEINSKKLNRNTNFKFENESKTQLLKGKMAIKHQFSKVNKWKSKSKRITIKDIKKKDKKIKKNKKLTEKKKVVKRQQENENTEGNIFI